MPQIMNDLNITFFQQEILWGDAEANRRKVEACMAGVSGADIFVVPETFTTGFGDHMAALAEEQEGPTLQWARQMAARHGFLFVGTWIVREGDRCYNRLHWVYPDGTFGCYDKAHTFRPAASTTSSVAAHSARCSNTKAGGLSPPYATIFVSPNGSAIPHPSLLIPH